MSLWPWTGSAQPVPPQPEYQETVLNGCDGHELDAKLTRGLHTLNVRLE